MSVKMVFCHGRRRQLKRLSVYKNAALIWGTCQPAGHFYVVGKSCPLSLCSLEKQDLRTTVKNTVQNKARFMLYFGVHISLPATGLERSMCMGAACSLSKPEAVTREMIMAQFIPTLWSHQINERWQTAHWPLEVQKLYFLVKLMRNASHRVPSARTELQACTQCRILIKLGIVITKMEARFSTVGIVVVTTVGRIESGHWPPKNIWKVFPRGFVNLFSKVPQTNYAYYLLQNNAGWLNTVF